MKKNVETRQVLTGGSREVSAAGGATTPTVPYNENAAQQVDPGDIVGLWADAKSFYFARDFPPYGSRAWIELGPDDPRRLAAALDAAEMWRKYGDDVTQWLRDAFTARPPLSSGRSLAELDQAAAPKPIHELHATPGWPPIAVPGRPGLYLRCQMQEAA